MNLIIDLIISVMIKNYIKTFKIYYMTYNFPAVLGLLIFDSFIILKMSKKIIFLNMQS
jgi:hypothetical protein